MSHCIREIFRYADHLGPRGWFWVMAVLIIIGAFFLRGYGSRSND